MSNRRAATETADQDRKVGSEGQPAAGDPCASAGGTKASSGTSRGGAANGTPVSPGAAGSADAALKSALHRRLLADPAAGSIGRDVLRDRLSALMREEAPLVGGARAARLLDELVVEVDGLGPLEVLLADPEVSEIMLNGPGRAYVERSGRIESIALELDAATIVRLVERIVAPLGLRLDRTAPILDARLPDGSRLHAVLPPLAPDGPMVTIRRFLSRSVCLDDFGAGRAGGFLEEAVVAGWNILVAGATNAGKTTLLNALSAAIDPGSRIVTIEETAELRLAQPHVVRLEARPPNSEGVGATSVRDLVRAALRMRPDRIVVGEVRGGEALDMLQALNTGHDGSLSTVHANGSTDALSRIETLALLAGVGLPLPAIRAQVAAAIDAVVFLARREGGERRIESIAEVERTRRGELATRSLFERVDDALEPIEAPRRPPRASVCSIVDAWASC